MSFRAFGVMGAIYKTWEVCMEFSIHSSHASAVVQGGRDAGSSCPFTQFDTWRMGLASFTSAWKVSLEFQLGLSRRL